MKAALAKTPEGQRYSKRLSGHSFHRSRLTHLCHHGLVDKGMPMTLLAQIAGHTSVETTEKCIEKKNLKPLAIEDGVVGILAKRADVPDRHTNTRGWTKGHKRSQRSASLYLTPKVLQSRSLALRNSTASRYEVWRPSLLSLEAIAIKCGGHRY